MAELTGVVDRINAWFMKRLRGVRDVAFDGDVIRAAGQSYRLAELTRAVACQEELFAGLRLALILEFGAGRIVRVNQQDPGWNDLLAALDRLLLTGLPSPEWTTRLLAGAETIELKA